ncbi:MAG: D-alanyl-D-alanine carboxypeptidase family protein, partial [Dichotomicrobium sp.]
MRLGAVVGAFLAAFLLTANASTPASAAPALVIEAETGLVLYSEDIDRRWHPASLTKLMTAYLAFEAMRDGKLSMEDKLVVSETAHTQPPSKIGAPIDTEMSMPTALRALLIKSANDVAVMFAEKLAGSVEAFADKMNATAKRLGMTRTHFVNPHGLPDHRQVTTGRDMAILARTLLREFPEHAYLFSEPSFKIGQVFMRSHNALLRVYEGADGMKTGFICDSGFNVVASATRGKRQLIAVVMGAYTSRDRTRRARALLDHGFEVYDWKAIFSPRLEHYGYGSGLEKPAPKLRPLV